MATPEVRDSLHIPEAFSRSDAWSSMAQWRGQWELRGSGQWAVEERSSGRFVGRAGLHRPERPDWPGLEAGWAFHPRHWGKGYATEAGASSIAYAFEVMGADEVFSVILPENERSQAVARRLGLTHIEERVLSSFPSSAHGIWRLGRDEWQRSGRSRERPVTPADLCEGIGHSDQRRLSPPSISTTSPVT